MRFTFVLLFVAFITVQVYGQCDWQECDSGCRSRGNALGRCKGDHLCECVQIGNKCDWQECDSGCRSRGNSLGRCKGDSLCECVVFKG